ncbi:MAG: DNA alkylation repair protein [Candidatus Korarchaeota archaeon]|nr:DNA alkylation repair protein [Candidatus Korarchaeota archaeon]NIU84338.1 hypothetical protein [Candidatus Thorarchaeota archaeon]NIW14457.1 hypothetical protein [Candidatus Thorarchaeota archaeon]NIW52524.1 hypothetical protein [Candidatus Korarchaeota archaeon]
MEIEEVYSDIVEALKRRGDEKVAKQKKKWHKTPSYRSYGVRTSEMRALLQRYRPRMKNLRLKEKLRLAKRLYTSGFAEEADVGQAVLELSVATMTPTHFEVVKQIAETLNNWATSDGFCIHVMQPLLRKYPTEVIRVVRQWNVSANMWKRRASVVVFVRNIGETGEYVEEVLDLCDNLIHDEEELVRKGVGWALKDTMRGAKEQVLAYVRKLRKIRGTSTITLYAIRDLEGIERDAILRIKP